MKPRHVYLILCVAGAALPLSQFIPFLQEHGPDPGVFMAQLFATRISAFFALDVIVSAAVLAVLVAVESRRVAMRHRWVPLLAAVTIGVSLGLPLFLYMRERSLETR